jgi:hypothetical protein
MVDYNENVYGRRGLDGRSHIPALPFWVALIRIAQFVRSSTNGTKILLEDGINDI